MRRTESRRPEVRSRDGLLWERTVSAGGVVYGLYSGRELRIGDETPPKDDETDLSGSTRQESTEEVETYLFRSGT